MFAKFFIERPILANVIALVTMLVGAVCLYRLPVAQYPEITPPTVQVAAAYPGATPEVLAETVGAPIEQQINGVEGMMYMTSKSAIDGTYGLTITFELGTNLDMAQVLVQNRINAALPALPQDVQRLGVTVRKQATSFLMVVALTSPDNSLDDLYLSNYASLRLKDELARLPGVGQVMVYGAADYSLRVWLDPERLSSLRLTAQEVVDAIREQNVQVAAGQIGQPPTAGGESFQYTIQTQGRLASVAQFEDIIVKTAFDQTGRVARVKDVARVELGGKGYDIFAQKRGKPCTILAFNLLPGANALDVARSIEATMAQQATRFPPGMKWEVPFDTTTFVNAAVKDVYATLIEAALLVLVVILVFLQDWRAMLVPATTVPVTLLGSFAAMYAFGFSINLITLFGIILAIGIVVDDAIIVVEGAAHHMEQGLSAHDAAIQAMRELLGPILGITLVLTAVFLPAAFMPGLTGQLYRQFALVIASTAVISAINAATLKPTQCALWLKPVHNKPKNAFYRAFNWVYARAERAYASTVRIMVGWPLLMVLAFALLLGGTYWAYTRLPTGFLPQEDRGYAIVAIQLPAAASQERTREVVRQINGILAQTEGIADWVTMGGLSILDMASLSNAATMFVTYTDWESRGERLSQQAIVGALQARLAQIPEAIAFVIVPPAIQGLGQVGGFELMVQDLLGQGPGALEQAVYGLMAASRSQPGLVGVSSTYNARAPQLYADVDRTKAKALGIPLTTVYGTLQTALGSAYANDFNLFGRTYQVRVQADAPFRHQREDVGRLEVRTGEGAMVPLDSLVSLRDTLGPQVVTRYNLSPAASVFGAAAPGLSSGQGLALMEQVANANLPPGMTYSWTSMALQEKKVGKEVVFIFALAVLLVYLILAAQYESWTAPGAVILAVPLALLGTVAGLFLRGMDNNVYTQVGLVLLIALSSKNAILIVEFARKLRLEQGLSITEAAVEAARLRFRPILMTSFAFIMGVLPLVYASGAGAASRRAVGTAVFGGMLSSTMLAVLFVPVFFTLIQRLSERVKPLKPRAATSTEGS